MNIFILLFTFFAGHTFGALSFYFFHRVIFHGPLGRYPLLKSWKSIHTSFPRANFSGTYPIIDKMLGTYKPEPVLVKHRER